MDGDTGHLEVIALMRERLSSLEQRARDLEQRIVVGDNNVRQAIEIVKEVVTSLQVDIKDIAKQVLDKTGKTALRQSLEEIRGSINRLEKSLNIHIDNFNLHLQEHERDRGKAGAIEQLKNNWVQPVTTGIMIGIVLLVVQLLIETG